jgi:hypothetical protein
VLSNFERTEMDSTAAEGALGTVSTDTRFDPPPPYPDGQATMPPSYDHSQTASRHHHAATESSPEAMDAPLESALPPRTVLCAWTEDSEPRIRFYAIDGVHQPRQIPIIVQAGEGDVSINRSNKRTRIAADGRQTQFGVDGLAAIVWIVLCLCNPIFTPAAYVLAGMLTALKSGKSTGNHCNHNHHCYHIFTYFNIVI